MLFKEVIYIREDGVKFVAMHPSIHRFTRSNRVVKRMIYQGFKQRFNLAMDQRLAVMSNAQSADDFMEAYPLGKKNECQNLQVSEIYLSAN